MSKTFGQKAEELFKRLEQLVRAADEVKNKSKPAEAPQGAAKYQPRPGFDYNRGFAREGEVLVRNLRTGKIQLASSDIAKGVDFDPLG